MSYTDKDTFWSRLKGIFDSWQKGGNNWGAKEKEGLSAADAFFLVTDEDDSYSRSTALQLHLFGEYVKAVILVFHSNRTLHVICDDRDRKMFAGYGSANGELKLELHEKGNPESDAKTAMGIINTSGANNGRRLGLILKDHDKEMTEEDRHLKGNLYAARVKKMVNDARYEKVDVSNAIALTMQVKDVTARANLRQAAVETAKIATRSLDKMLRHADSNKEMTHAQFADEIENAVNAATAKNKDVDIAFPPIVQSGGKYNLSPGAQSTNDKMKYDVMIVAVGLRFRKYCANVARTMFIEPTPEHTKAYNILLEVINAAVATMKPGNKVKAVHESVENLLRTKYPYLVEKLINNNAKNKNIGFGIGLEFRDTTLFLNSTATLTLQTGMAFNLSVGFTDLKPSPPEDGQPAMPNFSVLVSDTYLIGESGAECLTKDCLKAYEDISFTPQDEEEAAAEEAKEALGRGRRVRAEDPSASIAAEEERKVRQLELAKRKQEEALRRLAQQEVGEGRTASKEDTLVSYQEPREIPSNAKPNRLFVDPKAETILAPINGQLVPFHVSNVKNVYKVEEGVFTVLRLQFTVPDKSVTAPKQHPDGSVYVRELTYRSKNPALAQVYYTVQALKKDLQQRLKAAQVRESLVEQESLKVLKDADVRLRDVSVRPTKARKSIGTLTTHANGFRFVGQDRSAVDVIFANIRSCFYQKADKRAEEVLMHLELINPILIPGTNKKTTYLQFFVEISDGIHDVGMSSRYDDEDEIRSEEEQRIRRKKWNERFADFAKLTEEQWAKNNKNLTLEFDRPFRELTFTGVPSKDVVDIIPTVHALVALDDKPPMVLHLSDIDFTSLERVRFDLKEFDIVFVFKDLTKTQTVLSVPSKHLPAIRQWLDSNSMLFKESANNIVWKNVLAQIREDVKGFYEEGGWANLLRDDDSDEDEDGDGEGEGDSEEESGSEYEADEEEEDEEEDEDDESSYASEESSEEGSDEYDEDEDEDEADWDKLEAKAKEDDRKNATKRKRGDESD